MSYYLSTLQEQALYLQNSVLISREFYEKELEKLLETNLVIVVEGQRRVGKSSVIISYLKQKSISFDKVFYFSKDLDNALLINNQVNLEEAFQEFQQSKGDPEYIVIDEIQDID
jgi:predicted AAA+ superfamily ATPase